MESFKTDNLLSVPEHYIEWSLTCPGLYHELDKFVLHAGLNFEVEDPFSDEVMLWVREFKVRPHKIAFRRLIDGYVPL